MKTALKIGIGLWALASLAGARVVQDWSDFVPTKNAGTYEDGAGTKISLELSSGPAAGEKALAVHSKIAQWGGAWTVLDKDLSKEGALAFKAKSSVLGYVEVGLRDAAKTFYVARIKVVPGGWRDFVVPFSSLVPTKYPDAQAPKGAKLDWTKINGMNFSPLSLGESTLEIGTVSTLKGAPEAKLGTASKPGILVAQDFGMLESGTYGSFNDEKGGKISLALEANPENPGGKTAVIHYAFELGGWAGLWMRAGDSWEAQDWKGYKSVNVRIQSDEPVALTLGFNDANGCAYVADTAETAGKGWQTLSLPLSAFGLNQYYQPPNCKKGSPQDLSHIETFNLAPKTPGKRSFKVTEVSLSK